MLTFRGKYKRLEADRRVVNAWDIFTGLSQANGIHTKETEADIAENAFF